MSAVFLLMGSCRDAAAATATHEMKWQPLCIDIFVKSKFIKTYIERICIYTRSRGVLRGVVRSGAGTETFLAYLFRSKKPSFTGRDWVLSKKAARANSSRADHLLRIALDIEGTPKAWGCLS